jgi:hypothetical protein
LPILPTGIIGGRQKMYELLKLSRRDKLFKFLTHVKCSSGFCFFKSKKKLIAYGKKNAANRPWHDGSFNGSGSWLRRGEANKVGLIWKWN